VLEGLRIGPVYDDTLAQVMIQVMIQEADVKIISYLLKLSLQKNHIQILADDTDIFVLLVFFFWVYKPAAQVSMRKCDGKVININTTASKLGNKSSMYWLCMPYQVATPCHIYLERERFPLLTCCSNCFQSTSIYRA